MTRRVCYLARADRGDQIASVRLVGEQTDEAWAAPAPPMQEGAEAPAVLAGAVAAAGWVADRLGAGRALDVVCIDGEGGVCSWLTAPSAAASVVEAAFAQGGGASLTDRRGAEAGGAAPTGGGVSVQALGDEAGGSRKKGAGVEAELGGQRLAVLAIQDTAARLFLDALDDRGVGVGVVVSLWHAMARAWDRAAPADGARAERVVATEAPVVAVVLADPAGRMSWAWSRGGRVMTGGSLRLARSAAAEGPENGNGHSLVAVGMPDIGRLTTDWLSWAAQLGRAPARVVCIVPALAENGLTAAKMGEALGRAWPTATVDLVVHEDPIGATLGRLAREGPGAEGGSGLDRLTRRPGRAHRALHLWGALALLGVAAVLALTSARLGRAAAALEKQKRDVEGEIKKTIVDAAPDLAQSTWIEHDLESKIERLKGPPADSGKGPRPVLAELSAVVGLLADFKDAGVEPLDILIDENSVSKVDVNVPSSAEGEELLRSAKAMPSTLIWTGKFANVAADGKQKYSLVAVWPEAGRTGGK